MIKPLPCAICMITLCILTTITSPSFVVSAFVTTGNRPMDAPCVVHETNRHRTLVSSYGNWKCMSPNLPVTPSHYSKAFPASIFTSTPDEPQSQVNKLDTDALIKYTTALVTQMSIFFVIAKGLDWFSLATGWMPTKIPFVAHWFFFYVTALKSRVFNPLLNRRPQPRSLELKDATQPKRLMPSWTPPGVVFPIVWLLLIGNLRAVATALVVRKTETYALPAVFALLLHLSLGDIWNTINNTERRFGASVTGVYLVWWSKALATFLYNQVDPLAGKLLGITMVWLTIASALVTQTWRLNPVDGDRLDPLYPVLRPKQPRTAFLWLSKKSRQFGDDRNVTKNY